MKRYELALTYVFTGVFGAALGYKVGHLSTFLPSKPVVVLSDDRVIAGGQKYKDMLGKAYGDAWNVGANSLDKGVGLGDVMAQIGREWQAGRDRAFAATITPVIDGVVPEGTPDKDVTVTQKAQLAAGFRKFAEGLSK